ncbi:hypothetical protein QWI17_13130 [Gilvimarinus sp. SDUM040013]|uniref:Transglutaminase-like domain-containing protein n=1 Tax=Gilvimarinus gilvus TaxID=3058038 RepID=A0ABU4RTU2_9GAMM|nr:hypothetical protein [Gilvimarinus sp. SDUM040013]MDO3386783.1 hypothetical protein [Gilvimarinus sp. SDUM040013]MDX6848287.1 hypothetical protein [Gilvimarinus sp. SDUM040013]
MKAKQPLRLIVSTGRLLTGLLVASVFAGCSSTGELVSATVATAPQQHIDMALSGDALVVDLQAVSVEPAGQLLDLTPAMQRFAERSVAGRRHQDQKVEALHKALLLPESAGGMNIRYQSAATHSPRDSFRLREANCLGFSLLFVSLARHVGLDAQVNDVTIPPTWNLSDNRVQFMRHVNTRVDLKFSRDDMIIDLDMENYRSYYPQRAIDDNVAIAQFYNNRAMVLPANRDTLATRFVYLQRALSQAPEQSYLWNNMAALYSREGHFELAEALYLRALELNPEDLTAILNLSELYRYTGQHSLHRQLSELASRHRDRNPYYQYLLASELFDDASYELAAVKIETAIRRQPYEKRFYRLAADIYQSLGDESKHRYAISQL